MQITDLDPAFGANGPRLIEPEVSRDPLAEIAYYHDERAWAGAGLALRFVQIHGSFYPRRFTVRGLHAQRPPQAQVKRVRVTRGAIHDVVVDVRTGSPTYGRHATVQLSAENRRGLLVPVGFVHGFCTLEPDSEVLFELSDYNDRSFQAGLRWNDPALGIRWPCGDRPGHLFAFDADLPGLGDYRSPFGPADGPAISR